MNLVVSEAQIIALEGAAKIAWVCGGTVSSSSLIDALAVRKVLSRQEQITRVDLVVMAWRQALIRHNQQEKRFCTYDVETGEEVIADDHHEEEK